MRAGLRGRCGAVVSASNPASGNSFLLNILRISHCGSIFCKGQERLPRHKFFGIKILREVIEKNISSRSALPLLLFGVTGLLDRPESTILGALKKSVLIRGNPRQEFFSVIGPGRVPDTTAGNR